MARRVGTYRKKSSTVGKLVGIGALIALFGGGVYLVQSQKDSTFAGGFNDLGGAVGSIINMPVDWVRNGGNYVTSFFTSAEEVRRLRRENRALLEWRDGARAIAEKLETYEKLNNIVSTNNSKMVTGRLVAESDGPFAKSAIVNIGANQGVAANWIAVNQYGMVGRVVSVGKDTARVLLLNDGDSRVPVMGENTRGRAILVGDKTDAPRLEHLNIPALIGSNERVLTSGDDGILPRGVAVGTAGMAPDGKWRVKLATSMGPIDYVKLIAPNYLPAPNDKTNGFAIGQGMVPTPNVAGALPNQGAVLPLNDGAAMIPAAQTPEAIAQAQQLRKVQAELDATKKKLETTKKSVSSNELNTKSSSKSESASNVGANGANSSLKESGDVATSKSDPKPKDSFTKSDNSATTTPKTENGE